MAGAAIDPEIFSIGGTISQQTFNLFVTVPPPSTDSPGEPFGMSVALENAQGEVDTSFNGSVTLALTGTSGASLGGTLTVTAQNGVASFSGLTISKTGNYTIAATSGPATSAPASIAVASPTPTPTPTPTPPSVEKAELLDVTVITGRGKRQTKTTKFAGFELIFNEALISASATNAANYQVLETTKKGRKTVSTPVGFKVSYDTANDAVSLTLASPPKFPSGGKLILSASGIKGTVGGTLVGNTVFTILPDARGISG